MLSQDGHDASSYLATGAKALSMDDVVALLSTALGRTIRYRDLPIEAARAGLRAQGISDWQMRGSAEAFAAGEVAEVTDVVVRLTGRPPRSFAQFAHDLVAPS